MAKDLSQEFDLEEIMREFGSHEPEEKKPEEIPVEETSAQEPPAEEGEAQPDLSATTIRMEAVVEETTEEITVEEPSEEAPAEVPPAEEPAAEEQPVEVEPPAEEEVPAEEPPAEAPAAPEGAEAFTDKWEPEFEQPMGEYVPPQPILFQPRSRLRELKRQLIAGPEKLYYELAEKGLGKLQAGIFLSALLVILSGLSTALYAMNMVDPSRLRLMVFFQIFVMLLSALLEIGRASCRERV